MVADATDATDATDRAESDAMLATDWIETWLAPAAALRVEAMDWRDAILCAETTDYRGCIHQYGDSDI